MPIEKEKIQVRSNEVGRLDQFLAQRFPGVSRSYLQKMIAKGHVLLEGEPVKKGHLLAEGDQVEILGFQRPEEREILPNSNEKLDVLFLRGDVLVIDKPADLPTHPNDFEDTRTVANIALAMFPEIREVGDDPLRPGIVHRLDTNTSGALILAKSEKAFRAIRSQFDERKIKKTYLALVHGNVQDKGMIDVPLAHHRTNPRKMVAVKEGVRYRSTIREAQTLYEPLATFRDFTFLKVRTLTGRMHQVRVHLASAGHPLVGDALYQSSRFRKKDRSGLERHFLHASEIIFHLPDAPEEELSVSSDLPEELQTVLDGLQTIA